MIFEVASLLENGENGEKPSKTGHKRCDKPRKIVGNRKVANCTVLAVQRLGAIRSGVPRLGTMESRVV